MKITMEVDKLPKNFTGIVEYADRSKVWYKNGKLHREDGPAFEDTNGLKEWYKNGKLHREDGPAVEHKHGAKEWWLNGEEYSEQDFKKEMKKRKSQSNPCSNKIVEIDGKKYKLIEIS